MFSDGVVQAAVLFAHGCSMAPRDLHGNLDHGAIQCAENVEELVDVAGSDAVKASSVVASALASSSRRRFP